jgi:predicted nucleotidyltransferase
MTLQSKIVEQLAQKDGQTDRELADILLGKDKHQSPVNITCRLLANKQVIERRIVQGRIRNYLNYSENKLAVHEKPYISRKNPSDHLSEDQAKRYLEI